MDRPFTRHLVRLLGTGLLCLSTGCSDAGTDSGGGSAYDVPLRTAVDLEREIAAVCREATRDAARPVLVEFSAAWCGDCRKLAGMKREPALARELARWPHLDVNVARFDRHRGLLDALGVESIAHWAILAPDDCSQPLAAWPRIADRTLEVSSGAARTLSAADLAAWLAALRS